MTTETQRWIDAGKILAIDARASIKCPRCLKQFLEVRDVPNPRAPDEFERIMTCKHCGASNAIRMRRPSQDK